MSTKHLVTELIAKGMEPADAADFVARAMFLGSQMAKPSKSKHAEAQQRYRDKKLMEVITVTPHHDHCDHSPPSSSPSSSFPLTLPLLTTPPSPTSSEKSSPSSDWPNDFREQFWAKYPRKTGKAGALRKLETARRSGAVTFANLMQSVARYSAENPDLKFVKHPETWLSKGCWDDESANAPRAGPPDAKPAYLTPPPGCETLEVINARFAAARKSDDPESGTQVRNHTGVGANGAHQPAELPLSGGAALLDQDRRSSG